MLCIFSDIREKETMYMLRMVKEWRILVTKRQNVKKSCNRPGVAQRVPGGLGSQISMTFGP